jgi:hypothetical protein
MLLTACFMGEDGYEKSINDYFWLYKNDSKRVCLGVLDGEYRLANSYLCGLKKIGWDNSFLIFVIGKEEYFIQDLRGLNSEHPERYRDQLSGPFTRKQFEDKRRQLEVSYDLEFSISY